MTDQDMKKLSRAELLELLIALRKERDALETELLQVKAQLQDKTLCMDEAGSIAEAALKLNGVFESAQAAAQQYLDNIYTLKERQTAICNQLEAEARAASEAQKKETFLVLQKMEEDTRKKCQEMEADAREKSEAYWQEVSKRLQNFCQEHDVLKELLSSRELK